MKENRGEIMLRYLIFSLVFILWNFPGSTLSAEVIYAKEPNWGACVKVFDGGIKSNAQSVIRFYNGCPKKLYINACVTSREGEIKLYQSGRAIMTNGNYTLYTFPFVTPASIQWSASQYQPAIPPPCKLQNS